MSVDRVGPSGVEPVEIEAAGDGATAADAAAPTEEGQLGERHAPDLPRNEAGAFPTAFGTQLAEVLQAAVPPDEDARLKDEVQRTDHMPDAMRVPDFDRAGATSIEAATRRLGSDALRVPAGFETDDGEEIRIPPERVGNVVQDLAAAAADAARAVDATEDPEKRAALKAYIAKATDKMKEILSDPSIGTALRKATAERSRKKSSEVLGIAREALKLLDAVQGGLEGRSKLDAVSTIRAALAKLRDAHTRGGGSITDLPVPRGTDESFLGRALWWKQLR